MSSHVEVSPGGVGFIRTTAQKATPKGTNASRSVVLREWLRADTRTTKGPSTQTPTTSAK
ncbi:hypothetical protein ACIRCZ_19565 [Leifsonia sp. NPDC102414]|uniref:hypothetical protein n=1 Tax=Leifsonia sp. NPDC102414 TaxID=3364124 RepID=UPI003805FA96